MQLAKVIGTVVSTHKDASLAAVSLLLIQPLTENREAVGRMLVATDAAGAGVGEDVFFVRGAEASFPFYPTIVPTDATIVGIVDDVDVPSES